MHVQYRIPTNRLERVRNQLEQVGQEQTKQGRRIAITNDAQGSILHIELEGEVTDAQEQVDFVAALFGLDEDNALPL